MKTRQNQVVQLVIVVVLLGLVLLVSTFSEKITIVTPKAVTQETTTNQSVEQTTNQR